MPEPENKYARILVGLGFQKRQKDTKEGEKIGRIAYEVDSSGEESQAPKKTAAAVPISAGEPFFMALEAGPGVSEEFATTMADDGTGQKWVLRGKALDLRAYGFRDPFEVVLPN